MNFTRFDIVILLTMSLAIIFMSFTFPALGLTDSEDAVGEDDIPEYNMTSDRFDFVGEFPNRPGTPSTEFLRWNDENPNAEVRDRQIGDETLLILSSTKGDNWEDWELQIELFSETDGELDTVTFDENDLGPKVLSSGDWEIATEIESTRGDGPDDFWAETSFRVQEAQESESDGFLAGAPIVGTLVSAGSSTASAVSWIGSVFWWGIGWFFEISFNLLALLFDLIVYTTQMLHWLLSTYFAVVSGANSWGGVLLMVPGILLFLEFAKMTMIGISLLPTT